MSMLKVVFLDVDGVLHPQFASNEFDERCMRLLQKVVGECGAVIVLSSSRRLMPKGFKKVDAALAKYDMSLYDQTPDHGRLDKRAEEICEWLCGRSDVQSFVALDDMDIFLGASEDAVERLRDRFIRTSKVEGLIRPDAEHAIDILNSGLAADCGLPGSESIS